MKIGVIGSGSWGTAQVKILTDNGHRVSWAVRSERIREQLVKRRHNPHYLHFVHFDTNLLDIRTHAKEVMENTDLIIIAVPSAYMKDVLEGMDRETLNSKYIVSTVKGMIPEQNLLLNEYLENQFSFSLSSYVTSMGPCHAEEVAAEKLSYLTVSSIHPELADKVSSLYANSYINTIVNKDIYGVQYAAIMKNIYALGAGIAHGLEYGDNFQSVFMANCAHEMAGFLHLVAKKKGGMVEPSDFMASAYLGDLLVTGYSLFSRNRTFGNMIGKGYSVKSAQLEMNMVAEGYPASRAISEVSKEIGAQLPIAEKIYEILWANHCPEKGFKEIENVLI